MIRRLHVPSLAGAGPVALDENQSRHARDVLRLKTGDPVELFDDAGQVARGTIDRADGVTVTVMSGEVRAVRPPSIELIVAAAVPKGERADWLVEKLSELGVSRFIPLRTARSVVHPAGKSKPDRWRRIATESAKQSRRPGVMRIDPLKDLDQVVAECEGALVLSTSHSRPLVQVLQSEVRNPKSEIAIFVGPEGGWTAAELELFDRHGLTPARLTGTILRIETAAVAAAAVVATVFEAARTPNDSPQRA